MLHKRVLILLPALVIAGCYSRKVEKVEPEKQVIIHEEPRHDVVIHEEDRPAVQEKKEITIEHE